MMLYYLPIKIFWLHCVDNSCKSFSCIFRLNSVSCIFFSVFIMFQFNVDRANAEEFLEVYKGVVAEYTVSKGCLTFCTRYKIFIAKNAFISLILAMGTIFCILNCCLNIVTIQNHVTCVNPCCPLWFKWDYV